MRANDGLQTDTCGGLHEYTTKDNAYCFVGLIRPDKEMHGTWSPTQRLAA